MKFKAVILDGTLINSLEDIADSMNTVLKTNKYLPIMKLIIILYSGTRNLVAKALKNHSTENEIESCYADLMTVYSNNCSNKNKTV
jgi:phosphoglycolate phosphatase